MASESESRVDKIRYWRVFQIRKMHVDLGVPTTWPKEAMSIAATVAADITQSNPGLAAHGYASDLTWRNPEADAHLENRLRDALSAHRVLVYHASRLLPHEVAAIRRDGIGPLTTNLTRIKLQLACETFPDSLSSPDVELLLRTGPLTWGGTSQRVRLGQLWVVAPIAAFQDVRGFEELLGKWGGEAIYRVSADDAIESQTARLAIARMSALSAPSIVELAVQPTKLRRTTELWKVMVGVLLGVRDPTNEWYINSRLPAADVVAVVQPDNPRWPPALKAVFPPSP